MESRTYLKLNGWKTTLEILSYVEFKTVMTVLFGHMPTAKTRSLYGTLKSLQQHEVTLMLRHHGLLSWYAVEEENQAEFYSACVAGQIARPVWIKS